VIRPLLAISPTITVDTSQGIRTLRASSHMVPKTRAVHFPLLLALGLCWQGMSLEGLGVGGTRISTKNTHHNNIGVIVTYQLVTQHDRICVLQSPQTGKHTLDS